VAETGSTNADLLAEAAAGGPEGRVLVTDHQTAGRGRQSRAWHDEPGDALLVSVLLRPRRAIAPLIPLVTGLAAVETVEAIVGPGAPGERPVGLKWPNDVLSPAHGERKLAGILAEATTASEDRADRLVVVVGMGLNLRRGSPPPPEIQARAVTLAELAGRPVPRDDVLDRFLRRLDRWLGRLEEDGPEPVLDAYRATCLTLGRRVRFATGEGERRGVATGISPEGALLLRTDDGCELELHAGDAHHLGAAEGPDAAGLE
jgi:BirA family biotin operon repressor/biotin-[acetyl-CoA-carboxylase] ligase